MEILLPIFLLLFKNEDLLPIFLPCSRINIYYQAQPHENKLKKLCFLNRPDKSLFNLPE
jgi:hypothetical protein